MFKYIYLSIIVISLGLLPQMAFAKNIAKKNQNDDTYTAIMSTNFNFNETAIDGEMRAPNGFFLQGRQSQSLSQMVKLRSSWKRQMRNSSSGVKATLK